MFGCCTQHARNMTLEHFFFDVVKVYFECCEDSFLCCEHISGCCETSDGDVLIGRPGASKSVYIYYLYASKDARAAHTYLKYVEKSFSFTFNSRQIHFEFLFIS
jgi:hypothetical protein